jgi:hypothetical protein
MLVEITEPAEFRIAEDDAIVVTGLGTANGDGFERLNIFVNGKVAGIINPAITEIRGLSKNGDGETAKGEESTHKNPCFVLGVGGKVKEKGWQGPICH